MSMSRSRSVSYTCHVSGRRFPFNCRFIHGTALQRVGFNRDSLANRGLSVSNIRRIHGKFQVYGCYNGVRASDGPGGRDCSYGAHGVPTLSRTSTCRRYLFLCHRFDARILQLLVPTAAVGSSSIQVRSFITTFVLNVGRCFNGISRLQTTIDRMPIPSTSCHGRCLIVCSSIPNNAKCLGRLVRRGSSLVRVFRGTLRIVRAYSYGSSPRGSNYCRYLCTCHRDRRVNGVSHTATVQLLGAVLSNGSRVRGVSVVDDVPMGPLFRDRLRSHF